MFALKAKKQVENTTNVQVASTAAGMFVFFAVLRAAPWIISRIRGGSA
jgi:hypothetical protein